MPVPFKVPRFYPILDTAMLEARGCPVLTVAEALFEAGVRTLQYRHKGDWTEANFEDAKRLALRCQEQGVLFVLNDRADFARLLRCALHVGQHDLPVTAARAIISDEVIGFSTHNEEQLRQGEQEGVEYLSLGPIFATSSKLQPDPVVGLDELRRLRSLTTKPLVAIGGITLDNARDTVAAKADAVAVISGILPSEISRKAIRKRAEDWLTLLA